MVDDPGEPSLEIRGITIVRSKILKRTRLELPCCLINRVLELTGNILFTSMGLSKVMSE